MITLKLTQKEYADLIQFLKQREKDIDDGEEDLGLLKPLLDAYRTRVLWTDWDETIGPGKWAREHPPKGARPR